MDQEFANKNIIFDMYKDVKSYSLEQFQMLYTGWYLYGNPNGENLEEIQHKTDVIKPATLNRLMAMGRGTGTYDLSSIEEQESFVYEIKKQPSNVWMEWISIGRATNNDLVLRYPAVSKSHARLEIETTAFGDPLGYKLIDNHSTTGTVLNGKVLSPDTPTPVNVDDSIIFGNIKCIILDAATLWDKLR